MSRHDHSTNALGLKTTDLDLHIVEKDPACGEARSGRRPKNFHSAVIEGFLKSEHAPALRPTGHAEVRMERLTCSAKEAAASLGVCENTVWNYLRRGDLASVRVGGRRLIKVESVRALAGLSTQAMA